MPKHNTYIYTISERWAVFFPEFKARNLLPIYTTKNS